MAAGPEGWPLTSAVPITNLHEAWVLGNGDLATLVTFSPNELCFQFGKSDLWDSRFDALTADWVLKHDDLIRYVKDLGMSWPGGSWPLSPENPTWPGERPEGIPQYHDQPPAFEAVRYRPGPKPAGRLRLFFEALSTDKIEAKLDLARARFSLRIIREQYTIEIEAFIERERNILWLQATTDNYAGYAEFNLEKMPDSEDPEMPAPTLDCLDERRACVSQTIPAGCDVEAFTWSLCGHFPSLAGLAPGGESGVRNVAGAWSYSHRNTLREDDPLRMAVGIATTREASGVDTRTRSAELVSETPEDGFEAAKEQHEAAWTQFWSTTTMELDDEIMQAAWHRDLYALACSHGPDIQAPGLCANIPLLDRSAWHGDYHWNMNIGKMYAPSLPCGHPEWLDSYAALIEQQLPTFEYLSELIFDLPGAYVDHINFAYTPPHRTMIHNRWGRSLHLTGLTTYPLWDRWEYTRDVQWLRRIYPFLRGAAVFYSAYMDKYFDAMGGAIGPSMWSEGPGWHADFKENMNLENDLLIFPQTLLRAVEAAETLGEDIDARERWRENAARGPEVPYGNEDPDRWQHRQVSQCARGLAAWGLVEGDEPDGIAAYMRTCTGDLEKENARSCRHMNHELIGLARLHPRVAYDVFHKLIKEGVLASGQIHLGVLTPTHWRAPEDQWLATRGTAELLLQSQGGVIRLFPGWPPERAARFASLPARNGFVVDAEQEAGGPITAHIHSNIGGTCRLRRTATASMTVTCEEQTVETNVTDRELAFETEAGKVYRVSNA
jgi:hypothetical protein